MIDKQKFNKDLIRLAFPIALQSLMLASVAAADALMLGKVAQDEMTAVSLATQIQFVQNMFLGAVTGAGAILGAQYKSWVLFIRRVRVVAQRSVKRMGRFMFPFWMHSSL